MDGKKNKTCGVAEEASIKIADASVPMNIHIADSEDNRRRFVEQISSRYYLQQKGDNFQSSRMEIHSQTHHQSIKTKSELPRNRKFTTTSISINHRNFR